MRYTRRKDAPRVRDGAVQYKNNWTRTCHWSQTTIDGFVVDRERPGEGYRHILRQRDVAHFIQLLPEWDELSKGVDVVLLAMGDPGADGWYSEGIVAVCAWSRGIVEEWSEEHVEEHRIVLDRLGVPLHPAEGGFVKLDFTETSVKGFQLMHILLHELGHHRDRMTSRKQQTCGRGESFAEQYASRHADQLWESYYREFGW